MYDLIVFYYWSTGSGTLTQGGINIFHLLRQVSSNSTRCLSAKALSFWREERAHKPSDAA